MDNSLRKQQTDRFILGEKLLYLHYYQTANNPIFEVFYLEEPHGVIADFSGNLPYEF